MFSFGFFIILHAGLIDYSLSGENVHSSCHPILSILRMGLVSCVSAIMLTIGKRELVWGFRWLYYQY